MTGAGAPSRRDPRFPAALGAAGCLVVLLLGVLNPRDALAGWLVAFVFWSGAPLGALVLALMTRLIPGAWGREVNPATEILLALLPVAALAVLPILLGVQVLYAWAREPALASIYLTEWFFALRSLVLLAGAILLALLLLVRPARSLPIAAIGLMAFVLLDTAVAVDWLLSLERPFHSSGFGLYILSVQTTIALMAVVILRLGAAPAAQPGLLGALMLTSLLLWAYLAFMQYFIIWSENLPDQVAWYQRRGMEIWGSAEYAIAILHLAPLFLLFFTAIRRSRRWLLAMAGAVLLGTAIEVAWLVFPALEIDTWIAAAAAVAALVGLCALSLAALRLAGQGWRVLPVRSSEGGRTG